MDIFLDTNQLDQAEKELDRKVFQFLAPGSCKRVRTSAPFAIDNGCFGSFKEQKFLNLLTREYKNRELCRFVTCPDVPGSARRTLEVFEEWQPKLTHWRVALAIQDGQEDLPIDWHLIDAVFIGGSTRFKTSDAAAQVIRAAQIMKKWVHVGRVNTPQRFQFCEKMKVDSIDGTGIAKFSSMREIMAEKLDRPALFQLEEHHLAIN